jgi:hypothetical protein
VRHLHALGVLSPLGHDNLALAEDINGRRAACKTPGPPVYLGVAALTSAAAADFFAWQSIASKSECYLDCGPQEVQPLLAGISF